jgi:hypothetical protein
VFDGAAGLGEATGLPILGTITVSDLLERQRRRRRSYVLYAVSVLVLVVVGVVVLKLNAMGLRLDPKLIGLA